jgi:cytochrome c peroxidase
VRPWRRSAEAALATAALLPLLAAGVRAHGPEPHAAGAPAAAAGTGAFGTPAPGTYALPPLGEAADGEVLTSEGAPARLHDLFGGRVVLLSFVYTHCSDAEGCPLATAVLHRVGRRLAEEPALADRVRLLSLSFDPERDTPEVMHRYAESFSGGSDWRFLTGRSEAALRPLLDAYGQTLRADVDAEGNELGTISHLLRVVLIDGARRVRQIYSASFLDADALVADVETLLLEEAAARAAPQAGAPAGPAGREAAAPLPDAAARLGPGDGRAGYESAGWRTRSLPLAQRRGAPVDLAARVHAPPLGLPAVPVPADDPVTPEKVALGRRLFYDRRLSHNDTVSCASCHVPEQGFTHNEIQTAIGIEGRTVRRNAPSVYNVAYLPRLFLDGRETRLAHQVWGPLLAANEMGNPSVGAVLEKLRALPPYPELFLAAFPGRGLSLETLGMAIASYERTLVSGGSPFDRWRFGGETQALPAAAQRGFALFSGRAGCASCHPVGADSALFTDGLLHNTGVGFLASMGAASPAGRRRVQVSPGRFLEVDARIVAEVSGPVPGDLGLYEVTRDPADRWKYRTPSLRNVALTAPYMHDGSLASLADVVRFYDGGGVPNEGLDPRVRPLGLGEQERADLVAFLESLTGADVPQLVADAFAAPVGDAGSRTP